MSYLSAEEVLAIHALIIERFGGLHGIRDLGLLESAVARPQSGFGDFEAYPTVWDKAAVLAHSLIKNHAFLDGNKRTGMMSAAAFLELNGYLFTASNAAVVRCAIAVASNKRDEAALARWFRKHAITS